jgi:hypothetical protein
MLKRAFLLRETIEKWLTNSVVIKLQCLKLTESEWKQIKIMIELLRSFQQVTNSLDFFSTSVIHIAWIVYNIMHVHLKNSSQQVKHDRNKFLMNLRSIISATQKKLKKYYEVISSKEELYFNLELCLNSCDKLSYYKISKSLIFIYVALLVARSFFFSSFLDFWI